MSEDGRPYTFSNPIADTVPTARMDSVDVDSLLAEDELETEQGIPIPFRFGYPFDVTLGLDNAGTWTELANGDRVWRLRIAAPGAQSARSGIGEISLVLFSEKERLFRNKGGIMRKKSNVNKWKPL